MYDRIFNLVTHREKELKMTLIVHIAMILIGILAMFMFKYLEERQ